MDYDLSFRRFSDANNNLFSFVPTNGESDSHANVLVSSNSPKPITSKVLTNDGTKTNYVHNLNDEKSLESEDSETERDGQDESDDGYVVFLGEKEEDLDDLDKLMDIMEAEINGVYVKPSKKNKKSIKQNNKNKNEKSTELKIKNKLTVNVGEPNVITPKVVNNLTPLINPLEEELETIKTLEEIRKSPAQCILLNSCVPLKSPLIRNRKKSISPDSKLRKRPPSRSPLRRFPTPDGYRYSPFSSRAYRSSISPRISLKRLSPLKENNLSPRRYSPLKSRCLYRSPSPKRSRRSLSKDISPTRRGLSPLKRRSKSLLNIKSKSRSPSPLKKVIRSRSVSSNVRRKNNKILDDEYLKKKEKFKLANKQIEYRSIDPVLKAKKTVTIQNNDLVNLRTELKRKRALRLNTIQVEIKKKPKSFYPVRLLQSAIRGVVKSSGSNEVKSTSMIQVEVKKKPKSFYPARLLQSAIRDIVGFSGANEVKRKNHSKIPETSIKTEGNLDSQRVIMKNRDSKTRSDLSILRPESQEVYDNEGESYTNVKKPEAKLKNVPMHFGTIVNSGNTIQKECKKIKNPIIWP